MLNLTTYLPTPFEMVCGKWTITSPVPTVETGKLITLFHQIEAEQARRAEAGEAPLIEEHIDGWPTTHEEVARLVLSDAEYDRLIDDGCPPAFIITAANCALIYWANGASEAAVSLYLNAVYGENPEAPKD